MNELNNEILEAIKKNLPQTTAGELKKFIEQADIDKITLHDLKNHVEVANKKISDLVADNNFLSSYRLRLAEIERTEKEQSLERISQAHARELLGLITIHEREKTQNMMDVVKIVFKSQPVGYAFTRNVYENGQEASGSGQYGSTVPTNKNITENVTRKEVTE